MSSRGKLREPAIVAASSYTSGPCWRHEFRHSNQVFHQAASSDTTGRSYQFAFMQCTLLLCSNFRHCSLEFRLIMGIDFYQLANSLKTGFLMVASLSFSRLQSAGNLTYVSCVHPRCRVVFNLYCFMLVVVTTPIRGESLCEGYALCSDMPCITNSCRCCCQDHCFLSRLLWLLPLCYCWTVVRSIFIVQTVRELKPLCKRWCKPNYSVALVLYHFS